MVSLVFTCEWIDRALLNVALEPMKIDLGLSDTQVGAVASASYWVATLSVLPIGRFADHSSRRDVIACALCICAPQTPGPQAPVSPAGASAGALGTVLTGFAQTFTSVCLARMVVGLGTAGFFPVTEAFIADFFVAEERVGLRKSLPLPLISLSQGVCALKGPGLRDLRLGLHARLSPRLCRCDPRRTAGLRHTNALWPCLRSACASCDDCTTNQIACLTRLMGSGRQGAAG